MVKSAAGTPPILVFPNWDAVADGSRPFHVYCDACVDEFGAAPVQEQSDGSMKPIACISRATLDLYGLPKRCPALARLFSAIPAPGMRIGAAHDPSVNPNARQPGTFRTGK